MLCSLAALAILLLGGCAANDADETRDWPPERLYSAARAELDDKNYEKAIGYYEKLDTRYPYGPLAQQGKLDIAYALWKKEDSALALAACDRFIREHPNHVNVDYAYYIKGRINFNEDLGLFGFIIRKDLTERDPVAAREAFDAFKILVTRFPDSKYAKDARARMIYLVNALASHEAHVAEYYFHRGAYVAAVNRAQEILTTYPQSPAVERALAVIVASYEQMGLEELRESSARMARTNFPDSKLKLRARQPAWWKFW